MRRRSLHDTGASGENRHRVQSDPDARRFDRNGHGGNRERGEQRPSARWRRGGSDPEERRAGHPGREQRDRKHSGGRRGDHFGRKAESKIRDSCRQHATWRAHDGARAAKLTAHSLRIAAEKGLKTIAFPAVGTGIAGFPLEECAEIMLREVDEHLKRGSSLEKVYFVLFDGAALKTFEKVRRRMKLEA